jgi:hypothetical protein
MAKTKKVIDSGRRVFTNLKYLYFTPWKKDEDGSWVEGDVAYDVNNIVGDSTTVEQEDNEVNEIEHEFRKEPLYENTTLGNRTFTTECLDFQNDVLANIMGWTVDGAGNVYAPANYEELYCSIEMGFNSTEDVVVLPKVKMNSKAVLSSMKTDASRGTLSGTCYAAYLKVGENAAVLTDMAAIKKADDAEIVYSVSESAPAV